MIESDQPNKNFRVLGSAFSPEPIQTISTKVASYCTVIGWGAQSDFDHCVVIGAYAKSTEPYQLVIGNSKVSISRKMTEQEFLEIRKNLEAIIR